MSENWMLRRICGPKGEPVLGDCRKLHNHELYNKYPSTNIIREIKRKGMKLVQNLFQKPGRKRALGRSKRRR
jgi:hypothetical protein